MSNESTETNGKPSKESLTDPTSPAFDWVRARYECSLPIVFSALREQVEGDVKARNDVRPDMAPYEFSMTEDIGEFTVTRTLSGQTRTVTFKLEDHAIVVLDYERLQLFEVAVRFSEEGACQLRAKEERCELWQIRRMGLEALMFHSN